LFVSKKKKRKEVKRRTILSFESKHKQKEERKKKKPIKSSCLGSWLNLQGLFVQLAVIKQMSVAKEVLDEL
jgi:hypothetical protein